MPKIFFPAPSCLLTEARSPWSSQSTKCAAAVVRSRPLSSDRIVKWVGLPWRRHWQRRGSPFSQALESGGTIDKSSGATGGVLYCMKFGRSTNGCGSGIILETKEIEMVVCPDVSARCCWELMPGLQMGGPLFHILLM